MKNKENRRYIKLGVTITLATIAGISFFMLLFKADSVSSIWSQFVSILMPFIYGAVIAYILTPLCRKFEAFFGKFLGKKASNFLAIVLSIVLAVVIIVTLIVLVVPQFMSSLIGIANTLPAELESAGDKITDLLERYPEVHDFFETFTDNLVERITNWMKNDIVPWAQATLGSLAGSIVSIVTVIKNIFIGVIVSIYILGTRRQFALQANMALYSVFKEHIADLIREEVIFADRMFNGFLVGKIVDSAIIGVICFAGCMIMGFNSPILIAVIIGVTNIIPFFGPFIGAVPCAFILLLDNPMHAVMFVIFIIVLQQVDGNIIGPMILGNATGVSGFWVLFAILLFGGLWGIAGMIVGVPLFAVISDIVTKLVKYGLGKHEKTELYDNYIEEFKEAPKEKKEKKGRKHLN